MVFTPFKIVVVGGGTAGWMTAAALSNFLSPQVYQIRLVESEQIGTVGVGEATVPHIRYFNETLGINENEFMRCTNATYKLGIQFVNWAKIGDAYIHPFGIYGKEINGIPFHHYWLKAKLEGNSHPISDYSLGVMAAAAERFDYPLNNPQSLAAKYSYAFHIDASKYALFLRDYAEKKGVKRFEGRITSVVQDVDDGSIQSVALDSGLTIDGDLFIDCSGFRGLLIEQTLKTGYEDWSHWLPCDRAVAVPTTKISNPLPYTKAVAQTAGWQWRIPLQTRTGNGQVYCSHYCSDEQAAESLLAQVDGEQMAGLNQLRFNTGRRKKTWNKNCVSIGLSSGFLEPLESTSIYLIQIAIMKLIEYFPRKKADVYLREEFNRELSMEYERVRDFLILHYTATERDDSEFWRYLRNMRRPDSLDYKIKLFQEHGHVEHYKRGMFLEPSWVAVYLGQGVVPKSYHPLVNGLSRNEFDSQLSKIRSEVRQHTENMAYHWQSINKYLGAPLSPSTDWPPATMSLYGVFS